jgi:hypothetical protein
MARQVQSRVLGIGELPTSQADTEALELSWMRVAWGERRRERVLIRLPIKP